MKTNSSLSKISLVAFALFALAISAAAQQVVWTPNSESLARITPHKAVTRLSFPRVFRLYDLDAEPLRQRLFSIVDSGARAQSVIISLPNANGEMENFEVWEASNFEPDLQAQFPDIRAFSGAGLTDRYATMKLSYSPQGIQATVFRTETETEFIEPYSADLNTYAVFRTSREKGNMPWACSTEEKSLLSSLNKNIPNDYIPSSSTGEVRTMRLAQSCNGEYANFFGATSSAQVALVIAAFNATITRVNGVNEKDLAIHFNLIAGTTSVIYYDPATDPYTTLSSWNAQLQAALTANVGEANYDIGHMFGASGGGGNAGCIGCVCVDGQKGSGITSPADGIPQGDNFDIDYVVHEMGHQLGGNHTFSMTLEGTGVNKEIGSGITIMGYAGITSQDVAPHSIDTFHEANIAQIQTNLATKTCPVTTVMTANHPPVVAPVGNYTIPITTPFTLKGSATDLENDPLTYQWEQNDNSTTSGAASIASPTKATGPNWLTFRPSTSGTRTFPQMSTVLAGLFVTPVLPGGDPGTDIEALSSVSRTLNFRLTVRDNNPYVPGVKTGQTQFTDTVITVSNAGGPFKVTSPNTNVSYTANTFQTITWSVANTTAAPFSVANVKISLSTDGGATFPTVLAASTPNDGTELLQMPNTPTGTARIKVEALGNIFFDVSDANFTIAAPGPNINSTGVNYVSENGVPANGAPDPGERVTVSLGLQNTGDQNSGNVIATLAATGGVTNPTAAQSYGVMVAGGSAVTQNFSFTVNPAAVCGSSITLTFTVTDGVITPVTVTKTYSLGTVATSLSQNFDSVTAPAFPAGWTPTQDTATTITWVTTATGPSSAPNSAFANDPATAAMATLESPVTPITTSTAQLKFKNSYVTEASGSSTTGYDGMVLEIKIGAGVYQDILAAGGTFASNGYNRTISSSFSNPLAGRQAWSGTSAGYLDTVVNLPAAANGQNIQLRWRMGSDSSVGGTGVNIDDVQVIGGTVCATIPLFNRTISDFDGDGKTDVSVYRPSDGNWYLSRSTAGFSAIHWGGNAGDVLVPGDYDGDGKADFAIWRPSDTPNVTDFYVLNSNGFTVSGYSHGATTDIPVTGDFDGDGKSDIVVWRPSTGTFWIYGSQTQTTTSAQFGSTGDIPMSMDNDADGKANLAVYRPSNNTWYIARNSGVPAQNFDAVQWGIAGDILVPGDYDGDGKADVAVFRPSNGTWYIRRSSNNAVTFTQFGQSGDIAVPGDYDGDGKTDVAVFRSGTWFINGTTSGFSAQAFGLISDTPIPAKYHP